MKPTPEYISLAREMKSLGFPQPPHARYQFWAMGHDSFLMVKAVRYDGVEFEADVTEKEIFLHTEQLRHLVYLPTVEDVVPDFNERFNDELGISFYNGKWHAVGQRSWADLRLIVVKREDLNTAACLAWLEAAKLANEKTTA